MNDATNNSADAMMIYKLGGPRLLSEQLSKQLQAVITRTRVANWLRRGIPASFRSIIANMATMNGEEIPAKFLLPKVARNLAKNTEARNASF